MTAAADDAARARARRIVDADPPADDDLAGDSDAALVALAWAAKDECLAAWTESPPRAVRCAALAQRLAAARPALGELGAAAAWCAGIAALTRGDMDAALGRLDDASARLAALGQPLRAAQAAVPKVIALAMLGRVDEAEASALATRAALVSAGDELGAGKVEQNLATLLQRSDRYADAAAMFRSAAVRFARVGDAVHSIMADIGLAGALTWQFEFDEALRLYERAAMRVRARGLATLQGVIDSNRGRLELHAGRLDAALRSLAAALADAERDGMPQDVAEAERDLADAYLAVGLLPEAVALYARTIATCSLSDAPVERAWAEVQRAEALARLGEARAAADGLARAEAEFVPRGSSVGSALVALRQARLALDAGRSADALARADAAASAFTAARVEGWRAEAETIAAEALAAAGRSAEAEARFDATLVSAGMLPEVAAACHAGLGRLRRARGDVEGARAAFEHTVAIAAAQRARLPGDEFRTAYGRAADAAHDALLALALDAGDGTAQVLAVVERDRAQALHAALHAGDAAEPLDTRRRGQLRWLHAQWQEALRQEDDERAAALHGRLLALEAEVLEAERQAAALNAAPPTARPAAEAPVDLGAVQAGLGDDEAIVAYAFSGERLAIVAVTRAAAVHRVVPAEGLGAAIEQLRFQIDTLRCGAPALRRHAAQMRARTVAHLQALHARLWAPVADVVGPLERVTVVPHRMLHYVPFCALHDGTRHLVERHAITLSPSVALHGHALVGGPAMRHAAILGVGGPTLPQVAAEMEAVAAAFRSRPGHGAQTRSDAEATQPALHALLADADVLHLACHGQFRADSPTFSALHLADGPLTLRDAAALPLHARLVTLSACETGLSRVAPGDELIGLLRGFLLAGAPRVVASAWPVDDAVTAWLMAVFYDRLLDGAPPAQALRAAQRAAAAREPHPYHWAAFALHEVAG